MNVVKPRSASRNTVCFHRTGLTSWALSRLCHSTGSVWSLGVDVGDDGALRVADLDLVDGLAQPITCRRHERGVEGARHRQRHQLLRTEFFGHDTCLGDRLGRTGDHDLAGAVVVGDPYVGGDPAAGQLDVVVVEAEHGGHRAFAFFGGDLHGLAPFGHEPHRVGEIERARGGEGRIFAEAVPGVTSGFDADTADRRRAPPSTARRWTAARCGSA